ncbi:YtxH domain-containing protein [Paenibacillus montanisoli]|uniref:YtxH domain-containing protein n=1 Tax=Paenibacillus montanisoli TaxID=2081970 RepID=A0A328UBU7_9BACL|nr:YtxH domain-containing protein [Paenibacillus montanisoli]RAP77814.1 YtxH domain-containing protein [Paenibacillus montanisoli]
MAKSGKSFLFGAIAGGVIGSVTALLLAPKSGRELRKDIADGTQAVSERTVHIAGQVGDSTVRIAKQVGNGVSTAAVKAKDTASSVIDNVRSWRSGDKDESLSFIAESAEETNEFVHEAGEFAQEVGEVAQEAGEAVQETVAEGQEQVEELVQERREELQPIGY